MRWGGIMMRWVPVVYLVLILCTIITCFSAGCTGRESNYPNYTIPGTIATPPGNTAGNASRYLNLTVGDSAELHKGNITLLFQVHDKSRDPVKQSVLFDLTVKNIGSSPIAELQYKLSDLYATDITGNVYQVPTHVALIGLAPNETRSGIIEITDVPDLALPGLTFHYRFGDEEASWVIIPATIP
jgi:hypothetical protein